MTRGGAAAWGADGDFSRLLLEFCGFVALFWSRQLAGHRIE
jgi:hypothetical protein